MSDSWFLGTEAQVTPDVVTAFQQVFEQGAIGGIGFYFSPGDSGDWSAVTPGLTTPLTPGGTRVMSTAAGTPGP